MGDSTQFCSVCGAPLSQSGANELCGQCQALRSPATLAATLLSTPSPAEVAPSFQEDTFGLYTPLRILGEGGMGTVYLARQERPFRREVALKVIKLGLDSKQVIVRFESERQALALIDHPNVARVLDAGTSERGRPYFVMEYVDGIPITQYCDAKPLNTRQRLELFIPVCDALQHAHRKGIIHRDVKPSNILVTEVDGKPVPKVIDFGIARATDQGLLEREGFTLAGQIVGTPEYMSPEQASLDTRDIDTGTDVYSLGIVLYELLVGALPLDSRSLRQLAFVEVLRAIRETPSPKPTTKLTQMGAGAEQVARNRGTDPGSLKRQLSGDLDWIVMKAIDKDRRRRYASASEFATDIGRFLKNEPVLAGPPAAGYRIRKFVIRHKGAVSAAIAIVVALVAGIITTTWQSEVAIREKHEAERATQRANESNRVAVARQLAAQALLLSQESASNDALSTPLGIESARRETLFDNNVLLNKAIELLPKEIYPLQPAVGQMTFARIMFSGDGRLIATTQFHDIRVFDTATRKELWRFRNEDPFTSATFVPIISRLRLPQATFLK